jgi:hypothetical protein
VAASPTKQIEATLTLALGEASLQSPCSTPTAVNLRQSGEIQNNFKQNYS